MGATFIVVVFVCIPLLVAFFKVRAQFARLKRDAFIRSYVFPTSLLATLKKHHSHLAEKDHFLIARALRQFFLARSRAGQNLIGMPSRVVDDLWHEFILNTKEYARFCQLAFGSFFHHVPASATPKGADMSAAVRLTWKYACLEENINPKNATRLPLLFAIDAKLSIAEGFRYNTWQLGAAKTDSSSGCGGSACSGGNNSGCADSGDGGGGDGGCGGGCGGD